jgi:hypothetical protein
VAAVHPEHQLTSSPEIAAITPATQGIARAMAARHRWRSSTSGGSGVAAQPDEEAFQVIGALEVGILVGCLCAERVDLPAQVCLPASRCGIRARRSSMVIRCSENASIMVVTEAVALASAASRRMLFSARISWGRRAGR